MDALIHVYTLARNSFGETVEENKNEYCGTFEPKKDGFEIGYTEYLSDDAAYVGVFTHFKPGCRSMEELYKEYPGAWQFTFNSFRFEQCLNEEWHEAEYDPKFGFVTDSGWGESFSYHVQGEKLWLSPFFCRK